MHCYTLSSKGQITIPSKIREQFHLKAGDRIAINKSITSLKGLLSKPKKPLAVKK
ncbi:MAG: AbrB/MazE/SpoVT family DNA-binding domain-containing protein [Gammaproteobacteria bacterium]|nr:AbrB/MazE/SpoVT family DNA-binding domain-containing protein [Gammaproteobacteria bacterium]